MSDWSLPRLLAGLHDDVERRLETARASLGHPVAKGDASEGVWLDVLKTYLPRRYQAERAHVVDSRGNFSEQIDVLVFDRQYSPFIFNLEGQAVVPAESVYGAFEAKQVVDADVIGYAQRKVASVRRLHRTSLPIPHAGGTHPAKEPEHILGGVVSLESGWNPALGDSLLRALSDDPRDRLDIGCVAAHGTFARGDDGRWVITDQRQAATAFLLELITKLQAIATVPMIDVRAYARFLA
jgi:hypothetical protein